MTEEQIVEGETFDDWAPLVGRWQLDGAEAVFTGPDDPEEGAVGLLRAPDRLNSTGGLHAVTVTFPQDHEPEPQARIVFGFDPQNQRHFSAGLGGYRSAYSIEQFDPGQGYNPIVFAGRADALARERPYRVTVYIDGQSVMLDVDDVIVAQVLLPTPLAGSRVGLTARGRGRVHFRDFVTDAENPEAFVVMQFGEPYGTLYNEVIAPVCAQEGWVPVRADEFAGPGIIIEDIVQGIQRASVVIAEITPANPNVFYELGFAHASGKATILLADRDELAALPFDVSGRRCIFYNDSIGGKQQVEAQLRKHLAALPPGRP